jgi:hypothetical protein
MKGSPVQVRASALPISRDFLPDAPTRIASSPKEGSIRVARSGGVAAVVQLLVEWRSRRPERARLGAGSHCLGEPLVGLGDEQRRPAMFTTGSPNSPASGVYAGSTCLPSAVFGRHRGLADSPDSCGFAHGFVENEAGRARTGDTAWPSGRPGARHCDRPKLNRSVIPVEWDSACRHPRSADL